MFRKRDTHIHFVGIGGIGMSGIAEVLVNLGYRVTGTDLNESDTTRRLAGLGAQIHYGHGGEYLGDADVVVTSSAVRRDNPEVVAAKQRHIPVIPRAEMLAELMRLKQGIAIAGSHGKTTTTSLVASVLHHAGIDPTVVIGGKVNSFDSNARLGFGEIIVAEADESDGSFLYLTPTIAVITNIDNEHLDHYGRLTGLRDAFIGFANRVPFYGMAVVCADDPNAASIVSELHKRAITYGRSPEADYIASDLVHDGPSLRFRARGHGRDLGEFSLAMPGTHNVLNALATIAVCQEEQIPLEATRRALAEFSGVQRRFTVRGTVDDITVVDDYGHHPTEIRATLAGARASFPDHRLVVVFQPHRYTRLRDNFGGFVECLDEADAVVLTDVYPAGEAPIEGMTATRLSEDICKRHPARTHRLEPELEQLPARLCELCRPGDLVITLGAGNITNVSTALIERLSAERT